MPSDEFTTSFEKLTQLRSDIIDWIYKLVCKQEEEIAQRDVKKRKQARGSLKTVSKPPVGLRPDNGRQAITDMAFCEDDDEKLRQKTKQEADSSGCSLSTIARSGNATQSEKKKGLK